MKIYRRLRRDVDIETPTKTTTGKQKVIEIQGSRKGRLQKSKKRWKHGGGREQTRRKIYRRARRDVDLEMPTKKTTGKQREMVI